MTKTNQNYSRCDFPILKNSELLIVGLPYVWRIKCDLCDVTKIVSRACVAQCLCYQFPHLEGETGPEKVALKLFFQGRVQDKSVHQTFQI